MQSETANFAASGAATRRTGRNIRVIFNSGLFGAYMKNMTSSTKPKVHKVLHRHQQMTEPRPQLTRAENLAKIGRVVFWDTVRKRTDRQTNKLTNTLITMLCSRTGAKEQLHSRTTCSSFHYTLHSWQTWYKITENQCLSVGGQTSLSSSSQATCS